ncbi:MAG TPA: tRNA-dihydrouridine synthase, partial [Ignavibacteriales bacterium]|nr:tRNA-dihydrouridine synthase [Ignavibacteriales bacterium]
KSELSIPVIANGDVRDEESAERTLELTGCDGLMIGRAAMGNPFIFKRVRSYLETGEKLEADKQSHQLEDFNAYISLLEEHNLLSSVNLRMHAHWFTKGLHGSRHLREKINGSKDEKTITELIRGFCQEKY